MKPNLTIQNYKHPQSFVLDARDDEERELLTHLDSMIHGRKSSFIRECILLGFSIKAGLVLDTTKKEPSIQVQKKTLKSSEAQDLKETHAQVNLKKFDFSSFAEGQD